MAKYEVIAAGLYGAQGEIPVGTVVDLKDEPPESMAAKIRKVGVKVANASGDDADLRKLTEELMDERAASQERDLKFQERMDEFRAQLEASKASDDALKQELEASKAEADELRKEVEALKAEAAKPALKK